MEGKKKFKSDPNLKRVIKRKTGQPEVTPV